MRFEFDSDSDKTGWLFSLNYVNISQSTVGIDDVVDLPREYSLAQNYPNPFNPVTTIQYSVPKLAEITLIVYDNTGRKIKTLVNTEMSTGTHSVEFSTDFLSSGVYFYQLKASDFIKTKKMLLLK